MTSDEALSWSKPMPTLRVLVVLAVVALVGTACTDSGSADGPAGEDESAQGASGESDSGLQLDVASTRAEMVTGGDALLRVGAEAVERVTLDGEDVEVDFHADGDNSLGLIQGLPDGRSAVAVTAGGETAEIEVVNHTANGPVFSGERLPMVVCTTERYGLAAAEPPECLAEPVVRFAYLDEEGTAQFLQGTDPDPASIPADAATVGIGGVEQPVLLRVESRVINRGVATITTLANASAPGAGLDESWDSQHWNGRLVYRFGGGCGTTYSQGFNFFDAPAVELLADGYAFATNTLNTFQVQCQDIVSAEAAMMTKEYFAEHYGLPEVTIGEGGSGGAIQQFLIAQNYPGILDAIAPTSPFPDAMSIAPGVLDCALLSNYYQSPTGSALTPEQRQSVNGHLSGLTCVLWEQTFVPVADPTRCGFGDAAGAAVRSMPGLSEGLPTVPDDRSYDPETNPDGLRCTMQDSYPQIFEVDPDTGFAERPIDNIGVQYGLAALNEGVIDAEEFLNLNEGIGGMDLDARFIPERMRAEPATVERLYETGRVTSGGALLEIPIIVTNTYTDPEGDIHDRFRMFSVDERLADDDGEQAPGLVMWTRPSPEDDGLTDQLAGAGQAGVTATRLLDEWATALAADESGDPIAKKLVATRPDGAVNACFDQQGGVVASGDDVYEGPGPCTDPYPLGDDPRTVAGAPLANDVIKCTLQTVDEAISSGVYEVDFADTQLERLHAIFDEGVCDWSVPGVGQVPLGDPWRTFPAN